MITRRLLLTGSALGAAGALFVRSAVSAPDTPAKAFPIRYSEAEWRQRLTADQYAVLRQEGTERPFTSELLHEKRRGEFACAACSQALFSSATKYESGTGWPSFWAPLDKAVDTTQDRSLGMVRTEVHCSRCGGHLGHVFEDGPRPTGLRYCMNGIALKFVPAVA